MDASRNENSNAKGKLVLTQNSAALSMSGYAELKLRNQDNQDLKPIRIDYEASICARLHKAAHVPFKRVSLPGWTPTVGNCHSNVDTWVNANLGNTAVRGWVTYADFGIALGLTAHSVVRGIDGLLFDITPLGNEDQRTSMLFIPHIGNEEIFFVMISSGIFINCEK